MGPFILGKSLKRRILYTCENVDNYGWLLTLLTENDSDSQVTPKTGENVQSNGHLQTLRLKGIYHRSGKPLEMAI